jgi:hypothetical protein
MTSSWNLPIGARAVECPTRQGIHTRVSGARVRLRQLDSELSQPRDLL